MTIEETIYKDASFLDDERTIFKAEIERQTFGDDRVEYTAELEFGAIGEKALCIYSYSDFDRHIRALRQAAEHITAFVNAMEEVTARDDYKDSDE